MKQVTLIITSCNRLELLSETVKSFEKFNTYPIAEKIIIEDSGKSRIYKKLLEEYGDRFKIIFNNPPLKQISSIDRAYKEVKTEYIFHCEDDWEFYRPCFIEDSLLFLEKFSHIKQVGLRSIQHDILINHPSIEIGELLHIKGLRCYQLDMKPEFDGYDWVSCSFNPGLLRKKDYDLADNYASLAKTEAGISLWYKKRGFIGVTLENDAVKHLGWDSSTMNHYVKPYIFSVRLKNVIKSISNLFGGNYEYNNG
ncbi:glycosyltransferase family A protein [Phaeodactylibacter xiamenensis]|uniref:glycosyltransferase family A protein n=1 Tax=Phaeodactylibacter xiamenensis TaxID=1524460 RepID=UPI0024A9633E|nr:glycosyltransferase family A protein [Phaeodactylibacter xiamenensis]